MKHFSIRNIFSLLIIALVVFYSFGVQATAVSDKTTTNESESNDYLITINGKRVQAYIARTLDKPFADKTRDYGGSYSFANFEIHGRSVVRITSPKSMRNVIILPKSANITPEQIDDHTITITFDTPKKISIEPDGKKNPLLLFANPPEINTPKPDNPTVVYFGPGLHKPGKIMISSNQTVYLAAGAVVKGHIVAAGDNILICGYGILDGSDWAWKTGPGNMIDIRNTRNIEIRDITLRGAPHWSIVTRSSEHVTINNVKICNSRVQNDDGIDLCNTQDVLISNCFIRSDDDCIALKGIDLNSPNNSVERIKIENCILWCDRARIFLLGHESSANYMRDITINGIDIIHFAMTPFLLEPGEEMKLMNVLVENIRVNGEAQSDLIHLQPVVNMYMKNKVPGHIRNILFRNILVEGLPGKYMIRVEGADPAHIVQDVHFDEISILSRIQKSDSESVFIGKYTHNINFGSSQH